MYLHSTQTFVKNSSHFTVSNNMGLTKSSPVSLYLGNKGGCSSFCSGAAPLPLLKFMVRGAKAELLL